uniref:Uncharacterized protein n=1 Tax=viral metagenome TaxID=1070528 RepID=A0A6C0E250_9ZZZZ
MDYNLYLKKSFNFIFDKDFFILNFKRKKKRNPLLIMK